MRKKIDLNIYFHIVNLILYNMYIYFFSYRSRSRDRGRDRKRDDSREKLTEEEREKERERRKRGLPPIVRDKLSGMYPKMKKILIPLLFISSKLEKNNKCTFKT